MIPLLKFPDTVILGIAGRTKSFGFGKGGVVDKDTSRFGCRCVHSAGGLKACCLFRKAGFWPNAKGTFDTMSGDSGLENFLIPSPPMKVALKPTMAGDWIIRTCFNLSNSRRVRFKVEISRLKSPAKDNLKLLKL